MTKRSRRIPAASLFLIGLRAAVAPQTEDEMSIAEIIEDDGEREPLPIRVRLASLRDYEEMCSLFDELDELHRRARPEMFRPFPPPARTRAQWLAQPDSTVLVAQSDQGVVGLAVLLTRVPSGFAGAVPRKVVEVDNLVVRADQRGRRIGRRLLAAAVEWSRQRRATHVEVAVHDFNRDAKRFYESFGFVTSVDRMILAA
jgi:GNAT superfamily N-acetyltransferase